jgi:SAM-dependent methyltransferase
LCGAAQSTPLLSAPDRFHGRDKLYRLERCSVCTCVWLLAPPPPEEMGVHYDESYHRNIAASGESDAGARWQKHRDLISQLKQSGSILDIGCNSGGFLSTMNRSAWKLHGIEIEPSMAQKAKQATGAEVFVGDVMKAPFPDESFDVITCFDVLEHVYEPRDMLMKVRAWLKPGGVFYTVLPNIDSWESRLFGGYWYGLELPRHLFHFSPTSLRYVMDSLGFEEVHLKTRTSYVELSLGYVYSTLLSKLGFKTVPDSEIVEEPGFLYRAVRKVFRVTVLGPLARAAAAAGAGPSMQAAFAKRGPGSASKG